VLSLTGRLGAMARAADHSPLADLALALEEIDSLSIARLCRNHDAPVEPDLIALRAAVSRASVCLRKIEFWLVPGLRSSRASAHQDDADDADDGVVSGSAHRIIVAFRRSPPAGTPDRLRHPDEPYLSSE